MPISELNQTDFTPLPAEEAAKRFGQKAALTTEAFERLSREAKQHAFRVSVVSNARLIQQIRTKIEKDIRDGTAWPEVRKQLLELFRASGTKPPTLSRLRLMFQQNSAQAYNDARRDFLDQPHIAESFPFRQYLTVGNGTPGVSGVRPEHAALHGQVFRWDDPFWDDHTPPWGWGCRCYIRPLSADTIQRERLTVINQNFARTKLVVPGTRRRGVEPDPNFIRGRFDLAGIEGELADAVAEMLSRGS